MIKETSIIFTNSEVEKILSDHYNKQTGQNHAFRLVNNVSTMITLKLTAWNKDEKTH